MSCTLAGMANGTEHDKNAVLPASDDRKSSESKVRSTHIHTRTHTHTHTIAHAYTHTLVHAHMRAHALTTHSSTEKLFIFLEHAITCSSHCPSSPPAHILDAHAHV